MVEGMIYYIQKPNELYHYGVKGMKWGIRHDRVHSRKRMPKGNKYVSADGKLTEKGKKKYKTIQNYNNEYRYDRIKKGLLIAAGVSAAAIVGTMAWRHGVTYGDKILQAGTLVQNIAPEGRKFDASFYGTVGQADRRYFLKIFSDSKRNTATILTNDKAIKIAGRKAMDQAYREMTGRRGSFRQRTEYYRQFGGLDENQRQKFISQLQKKGYHGFKDVNDILIDWADTPVVFFGKDSGLRVRNSAKINMARVHKLNVNRAAGKRMVISAAGYLGALSSASAIDVVNQRKYRNTMASNRYGKQYKDLTKQQKRIIRRAQDNLQYKRGDKGSAELRKKERIRRIKRTIKSVGNR